MKPTEAFWDAVFDLAAKYGIDVTNNQPRPGLPHITELGKDILAMLGTVNGLAQLDDDRYDT